MKTIKCTPVNNAESENVKQRLKENNNEREYNKKREKERKLMKGATDSR